MSMVLLIVVFVAIVLWVTKASAPTRGQSGVEQELLARCMGDRVQVERLVQAELKRTPSLSREQAADRALRSLTRDQ